MSAENDNHKIDLPPAIGVPITVINGQPPIVQIYTDGSPEGEAAAMDSYRSGRKIPS